MAENTILIRHRRERKSKCSLEPLVGCEGFDFYPWPANLNQTVGEPSAESLIENNYIRLAVNAPVLSPADAHCNILLLDGTWKRVEPMNRFYLDVPSRSLPPLITAYPRVSKTSEDPSGGLASIEALAAAFHCMGRPWRQLLDNYHWRDTFIEKNSTFFN